MEFKLIDYNSDTWSRAVKLREDVLRKPLGSRFTDQELAEEISHYHVVGFHLNEVITTAVLVPEGHQIKMRRVVVLEELRGHNIGSDLMKFCEHFCKSKGYQLIYCHARDSAVNFYVKNGYTRIGDYFNEDGIPHLKMRKIL